MFAKKESNIILTLLNVVDKQGFSMNIAVAGTGYVGMGIAILILYANKEIEYVSKRKNCTFIDVYSKYSENGTN